MNFPSYPSFMQAHRPIELFRLRKLRRRGPPSPTNSKNNDELGLIPPPALLDQYNTDPVEV
jgi:hypothetical protein